MTAETPRRFFIRVSREATSRFGSSTWLYFECGQLRSFASFGEAAEQAEKLNADRQPGLVYMPERSENDPTREGIFRDHNCWKCQNGAKSCPHGGAHCCEYPHARND